MQCKLHSTASIMPCWRMAVRLSRHGTYSSPQTSTTNSKLSRSCVHANHGWRGLRSRLLSASHSQHIYDAISNTGNGRNGLHLYQHPDQPYGRTIPEQLVVPCHVQAMLCKPLVHSTAVSIDRSSYWSLLQDSSCYVHLRYGRVWQTDTNNTLAKHAITHPSRSSVDPFHSHHHTLSQPNLVVCCCTAALDVTSTHNGVDTSCTPILPVINSIHHIRYRICCLHRSVPLRGHHPSLSLQLARTSRRIERACSVLGVYLAGSFWDSLRRCGHSMGMVHRSLKVQKDALPHRTSHPSRLHADAVVHAHDRWPSHRPSSTGIRVDSSVDDRSSSSCRYMRKAACRRIHGLCRHRSECRKSDSTFPWWHCLRQVWLSCRLRTHHRNRGHRHPTTTRHG